MDSQDIEYLQLQASMLRASGRVDAAKAVESIADAMAMRPAWKAWAALQLKAIARRLKRSQLTAWERKIEAMHKSLTNRHKNRASYKKSFESQTWNRATKRMIASHDGKLHRARQKNCHWWAWAECIASNNRKRMHTREDKSKGPA